MNKVKKNHPPPKKCIFCGNGNLTGEHLFPDWLSSHIPRNDNGVFRSTMLAEYDHLTKTAYLQSDPKTLRQQGSLGNFKLRIVCTTCNSGWMSKIVDDSKPILMELLLGNEVTITAENQEKLIRFLVLLNIVSEYTNKRTKVLTSEFY